MTTCCLLPLCLSNMGTRVVVIWARVSCGMAAIAFTDSYPPVSNWYPPFSNSCPPLRLLTYILRGDHGRGGGAAQVRSGRSVGAFLRHTKKYAQEKMIGGITVNICTNTPASMLRVVISSRDIFSFILILEKPKRILGHHVQL